jgi:carbon-monoxide dehydrogenase medium subunit
MKPGKFEYYEPTSVDQAVLMLNDVAEQDGRVIAGGQTLVPAMALRFAQPAYLVDINGIAELQTLAVIDGSLSIGACVRHAAFHEPVLDGALGRLLTTVVRHIAHLPIRNRGTFCGSIANADPASEWCLVAATLDATLIVRSVSGERRIPASSYFQGFMTTDLALNELLVSANLPLLPAATLFGFEEFSRRAGDFAQAMSLAVLELEDGQMRGVRIGVGGVESFPRRLAQAEAVLEGKAPDGALLDQAAAIAAASVEPVDATQEEQAYRRQLVETVVRRALQKALAVQLAQLHEGSRT